MGLMALEEKKNVRGERQRRFTQEKDKSGEEREGEDSVRWEDDGGINGCNSKNSCLVGNTKLNGVGMGGGGVTKGTWVHA